VVCDHFPKPRPGRDALALVAGACERIGLPRPARVDIGRDAWLPGVPPCLDFCTERRPDLPPRYRTHVRLEFAGPVRGPLLLGAGRYFGLGLCRTLA
jgi:CRISPR-associated protein Csb2